MADETLRFDIVGDDKVSAPFSRAGASAGELSRKMDAAARKALGLDEALKRQRTAAGASADASLALARADKILEEAEHGLRDGALEAEFALKRETEAEKKNAEETRKAAAEKKKAADGFAGFADKLKGMGGPAWLGPALLGLPAVASLGGVAAGATIGVAGAAVAGAGALAAFGAVAKPVFADAQAAAKKVETAQNNYNIAIAHGANQAKAYKTEQVAIAKAYAELSPAQIALSKQIQAMGNAWQAVKAAQTPVVAGALQPWLKSVTDLTKNLGPIIAAVSPVIRGLGTQFDSLINSAAFRGFRDFIASTGTAAVSAVGSTLIDFVKGFIILLPKFDPLIREAVGWISRLGPAFVTWASSQKTADRIQAFMSWFSRNGPVVGGLLRNIAGALKAMAPGLQAGGIAELQAMSAFFALVARLPPGVAKPLFEVAGALLILNKLGVVSVGFRLLGLDAAKAAAGGGAGGLWGKILPGVRLAGGALAAVVVVDMILKNVSSGSGGKNWLDNPFGQGVSTDPKSGKKTGSPSGLTSWIQLGHDIEAWWNKTWDNTITRTARGFHDLAGWFDRGRHDVAAIWNLLWNNIMARGQRGLNDSDHYIAIFQHNLAHWFDLGRHDVGAIWNLLWNNTVSRLTRGISDAGNLFAGWWHNIRNWYSTAASGIASAWNTIWNNTVGRTIRGVSDTMRWIGTLPGRIGGVFRGARGWLAAAGHDVLRGFLDGLTGIWGKVMSWISGIADWIKAHKGPVSLDASLLYPAGHAMMSGLLDGLKAGFGPVGSFVGGLASWVGGKISAAGGKLAGGIVSVISSLINAPGSGVSRWIPLIVQALKMEHLDTGLLPLVMRQMQSESGGNPNAQNNSDINARLGDPSRGLMQVIGATFRYWHWPGTSWNIFDPLANIAAALNYAEHGKGFGTGMGQLGSGHGYALGTNWAAPGWAWVGERGPELMRFRGGEQVAPVARGGGRGGPAIVIEHLHIHAPVGSNPRDIGRQLAEYLGQFKKGGGWIYRPGGF